jgi:hypothetical protein
MRRSSDPHDHPFPDEPGLAGKRIAVSAGSIDVPHFSSPAVFKRGGYWSGIFSAGT